MVLHLCLLVLFPDLHGHSKLSGWSAVSLGSTLVPPTCVCVCVCLMCRQSVLIAVLVKLGALPESWKEYDVEDVSLGLQVHH